MSITIKDAADIEGMRLACRLASEVLDYIAPHIKPGITTAEIDRLGAECMAQQGTISATVGYQPPGYPAYPASLCTSVNHVVCHGIPNDKPLKKGDIVNVDVTVITKDGWYGDNSRMYLIGECSIAAKRLCAITFEAMWHGIVQVKPGARLGDIGHAIQKFAEGHGFSIVREFCGHGIGKNFQEGAQGPPYGPPWHARRAQARHGVHHRTHDQRRPARDQGVRQRRLDHRHQGPQPLGAMGAHRARHAHGLRGDDALGWLAPAALLRSSHHDLK